MDARTIRAATWRQIEMDTRDGYVFWTSPEVPGVARVAKDGRLFWRYKKVNYTSADDLVADYNRTATLPAIPEAAVRAALAAQLGVDPSAIPEDASSLVGMRRALEALLIYYIKNKADNVAC